MDMVTASLKQLFQLLTLMRVTPIHMQNVANHLALNAAALLVATVLLGFYITTYTTSPAGAAEIGFINPILSFLFLAFCGFLASFVVKRPPVGPPVNAWSEKWSSLFLICLIPSLATLIGASYAFGFRSGETLINYLSLEWRGVDSELIVTVASSLFGSSVVFAWLAFKKSIIDEAVKVLFAFLSTVIASSIVIYITAFVLFVAA